MSDHGKDHDEQLQIPLDTEPKGDAAFSLPGKSHGFERRNKPMNPQQPPSIPTLRELLQEARENRIEVRVGASPCPASSTPANIQHTDEGRGGKASIGRSNPTEGRNADEQQRCLTGQLADDARHMAG